MSTGPKISQILNIFFIVFHFNCCLKYSQDRKIRVYDTSTLQVKLTFGGTDNLASTQWVNLKEQSIPSFVHQWFFLCNKSCLSFTTAWQYAAISLNLWHIWYPPFEFCAKKRDIPVPQSKGHQSQEVSGWGCQTTALFSLFCNHHLEDGDA